MELGRFSLILMICFVLTASLMFGCGSDDGATNCATRSGFYEATLVDSGSCGMNGTMVLSIDDIDGPASGCTVTSSSISEGNCQVLLDLECKVELSRQTMVVHRFIEWSPDGNTGIGRVLGDVYDARGGYVCGVDATVAYSTVQSSRCAGRLARSQAAEAFLRSFPILTEMSTHSSVSFLNVL